MLACSESHRVLFRQLLLVGDFNWRHVRLDLQLFSLSFLLSSPFLLPNFPDLALLFQLLVEKFAFSDAIGPEGLLCWRLIDHGPIRATSHAECITFWTNPDRHVELIRLQRLKGARGLIN